MLTLEMILAEIPRLSPQERKELVVTIMESFTVEAPTLSLLDVEGVGASLREELAAQHYINQRRVYPHRRRPLLLQWVRNQGGSDFGRNTLRPYEWHIGRGNSTARPSATALPVLAPTDATSKEVYRIEG